MSTSTITYNSFVFPFTRLNVTETPVYASDKVSLEGTKYLFEVTGWLTAATHSDFAALIHTMHCQLRSPRKQFSINWGPDGGGASNYYGFEPSPSGEDGWGPLPGELRVSNFAGGLAAMYAWSIEAFKKECFNDVCGSTTRPTNILSFVRAFEHTVDADGFTSRTVSGKIRVSAFAAPADQYRAICVPSLPTNFKRESQQFRQSEDGTELSFSVNDVEQMYTLPNPVTSGQASFTVRIEDMGMKATFVLSGHFQAPASVAKAVLLQKIYNLASVKIPLTAAGIVPESREISTGVYHPNRVDFHLVYVAAAGVANGSTFDPAIGLNLITASPPDVNGLSTIPGYFGGTGNTNSGVISAAYAPYDACAPTSASSLTSIGSGGPSTSTGLAYSPESAGTVADTGPSQEHATAPYIAWHEQISYEFKSNIAVFNPKQKGAAPLTQQTAPPTMYIIQVGYASRYGKNAEQSPSLPKPVIGTAGQVVESSITPFNPEPVGDGVWNKYTVHWRYVMVYTKVLTQSQPLAYFPFDPRRTGSVTSAPDGRLGGSGSDGSGGVNSPSDLIVIPQ